MKSDHPKDAQETAEGSLALNKLLNELSFEPTAGQRFINSPELLVKSHQAPAGLRQRILLAQQAAASKPPQRESLFAQWFCSPWRAIAASAAPLLLGMLLGSNTTAAEFYATRIDPQSYPDNDQLLVLASLDSDFTATLGQELLLDWPQDGETNPLPALATPTDARSSGATTP